MAIQRATLELGFPDNSLFAGFGARDDFANDCQHRHLLDKKGACSEAPLFIERSRVWRVRNCPGGNRGKPALTDLSRVSRARWFLQEWGPPIARQRDFPTQTKRSWGPDRVLFAPGGAGIVRTDV